MAAHTAERRPLGTLGRMTVVAGIHAVALLFIANGLGYVPSLKPETLVGTIINDPIPPPPDPPPLNPLKLEPTGPVHLPIPEAPPSPIDEPTDAIGAVFVPVDSLPANTGSADPISDIFSARADPHHPLSQPPYPAELIRGNIEGAVIIEVYVQPDGRVADARIVKSSGYDAFDRNTLNEAKRKWRLLPAMQDGSAVPQWYRTRVVFKLTTQ